MILKCLYVLTALLPLALADFKITTPAGGDSVTGTSLEIDWTESGTSPPIADFASYAMFLCAGGNLDTNFIQLYTLVAAGDPKGASKVTVTIPAGVGAATPENAYFIKVLSAATGGSIINYSDRFSLPSMTGVFPASVIAGLKTVSGTSGPPTQNEVSEPAQNNPQDTGTVVAGAGSFAVPYTMQTGPVRYAPMQSLGQTKITVKNASPLFPTSAYEVYQTYFGSPDATQTVTQPQTAVLTTRENTAAAAGQPTDAAMQKFLNRWKD